MARPIRIDVEDGWYHVTARGLERREIYRDEADRGHFVDLLEGMVERYGVMLHAYILMGNHYHMLLQTPHANTSQAVQWLNVSYSVWYNHRHGRCGPVFQGRFKSLPVDGEGSWALESSLYLHLNPVRVRALGLGKREDMEERRGVADPTKEQIRERLRKLRGYRWSSYRAYAGYEKKPAWLRCETLWDRAKTREKGRKESYRAFLEEYVRQDEKEGLKERVKVALAIGSEAFREKMRRLVKGDEKEQPELKQWKRLLPFEQVRNRVAAKRKEPWERFRDRKGDWGRDVALWLGRKHCGMSLKELGKAAGGVEYPAVSKAIARMTRRLEKDRALRAVVNSVESCLSNIQT